jgi:flagellar motility protein MotE (MotC chaperone)
LKAVIGLLSVVALLGVVYGLAFFGIIPVQKMADKSPGLASTLTKLHLAKAKKPAPAAPPGAAPSPEQQALDAQKKQTAADRAQLDKDRADFEAQKAQPAAPPDGVASTPPPDHAAKLGAIYATMSADDLARIFGKLPDPDVIQSLTQLDEKKAGQVLAALPADRAARLTRQMSRVNLASSGSGAPVPSPRTSL